jgi:hypothetical protein
MGLAGTLLLLAAAGSGLLAGVLLRHLAPKEVARGTRWLSLLKRGLLLAFAAAAGIALGPPAAFAVPAIALLIVTFAGRSLVWLSYATLVPVALVLAGSATAAGLAFLFGLPSGSLARTGSAIRLFIVFLLVGLLAAVLA